MTWEIIDESSDFNNYIHIIDSAVSSNESESVCLIGNDDLSHAHALKIAHLIAAAPDLLEVLETILANADEDCEVPLDDLIDAKRIVAKARGVIK